MSSGQRPRWPEYFPKMKVRYRHRPPRLVIYDEWWNAIWPPIVGGRDARSGRVTFTNGETFRWTGKVVTR